jgi:hypothetical protein
MHLCLHGLDHRPPIHRPGLRGWKESGAANGAQALVGLPAGVAGEVCRRTP